MMDVPTDVAGEVVRDGVVEAITEFEAELTVLVPAMLVAVTIKVYGVPSVRPKTVIGELVLVPVILPGLEEAV
jgi:hypothetical protein